MKKISQLTFIFSFILFLSGTEVVAQNRVNDDPDLPNFSSGADKFQFLKARDANIQMIRGLDWTLPYNPRLKAIGEMQKQENANALNRSNLVQSSNWIELGPDPIPNGQTTGVSVAVSGRTTAIVVNPTNANIVYVGTANGGIYRTTDGGTTWIQIFDGASSLAIGALALAPSSPSTLYVGTGEANLSADSYAGIG